MMVSPVRSRATRAQTWGKGVRTFVKGDLASVKGDHGLRPRARAGSGLRPSARAFSLSGSAPRLASIKGDLKPSSFFSLRDSIVNISHE